MGVLGLYSYFESKSLGQRRSWTTASSGRLPESPTDAEIPTRPQRYFILDGNAYIHHLYCGQFEWIWGGQYSSFVKLLVAHITAIQASGFQLQILFDGPLPLQKLRTRLTRDTEKIHKLTRVMGDLEHYHILGLSNSARGSLGNGSTSSGVLSTTAEGLDALANNAGGGGGAGSRSYSHFLIPPLVMEVTLQTLRSLGVDLMVCDGEADGLVAQLALEKSMDPNVEEAYAVSKDSDYFIYNTGSSTKGGYIPLDSLFVAMDPNTSGTTISATVYSQAAISEHLGIRPHFLPLFASLTGNDYLRPDVFEAQIAKALITTTGQKLAGTSNTNHSRIKATAAFLKQYGAGSEPTTLEHDNNPQEEEDKDRVLEVMDKVLQDRKELYPNEGDEKQQELRCALMESMDQYSSLTPDLNFSALSTSAQTMTGLDRMKEAFRTGQFSFKLMDVVCNKMFWCTPFLEDTDRESAWLVSRELRRWIYGVLARNLSSEETQKQGHEIASSGNSSISEQTLDFDVVEYVRRGDHLSAETVTAASTEELDEILTTAQLKAQKRGSRRISYMDVDVCEDLNGAILSGQSGKLNMNLEPVAPHDPLDLASRTSLFLGILGAETEQVKALPKSFMVLAATLRYLVNALSHSKTRSASVSVANFEVIAFVASVIFLREKYYPETILESVSPLDNSNDSDPSQEQQPKQSSIPSTNHSTASTSNSFISLSDEAPPLTKRSLHLSTQYQHALGSVSLLANALHLEDMIPSLATLFDGLLFQQTLVLARGGTSLETRMQFPESVALYHQILAAVEEEFIDTGEIDVVVVFRSSSKKGTHHARTPAHDPVQLGIFGPDMEPVNQLATPITSAAGSTTSAATTPASGGASLKAIKSSGVQKKSSGSSKKRSASGAAGGGHSGSGGRNGSRSGTGANMFNVLSLGCEF
ncbi:hypothetical protein BGZ75_002883 [Mortierella antarctica]|nr:hypothetical protein BGZ75_002883 [Mortierella antarctica]